MKLIRALICIVLGLLLVFPAIAERETWVCPSCGRTGNTGNFCGTCGTPALALDDMNQFVPGETVVFGRYEQDNNQTDGTEPIEWLVLDYDAANNRALLISRYGLDAKPYNEKNNGITWEKCTLRTWLNGTFLNKAFTVQEQACILTTTVDNSMYQGYSGWNTSGGNNTEDKVFLLSYAEANKYLGVTNGNNNTKSRVAPTAYAIKQGAFASGNNKTADGTAAGWWWLRSPGNSQNFAATVSSSGLPHGDDDVINDSGCVRPAFWINLESDIF